MEMRSSVTDGCALGVCLLAAVVDFLFQDSEACGMSWGFAFVGPVSSTSVSTFRRLRVHRACALRLALGRRRTARTAWFVLAEVIESNWADVWRARAPAEWVHFVLCASSTCRRSQELLWTARGFLLVGCDLPGTVVPAGQTL